MATDELTRRGHPLLYRGWLAIIGTVLCAGSAWSEDPFLRDADQRLWKPVADDVYLQEVGSQIQTDRPILSVAHYEGTLYALTDRGGYGLDGQQLERVPELPAGLQRLRVLDGALWAMGPAGLYRMVGAPTCSELRTLRCKTWAPLLTSDHPGRSEQQPSKDKRSPVGASGRPVPWRPTTG